MRLTADKDTLAIRSRTLRFVREFFAARDFLEVETPIRLPTPALELHIDAEPSGDAFLRTSPELHLKRLLAAGHERLFEMGPCFRRGERGRRHNPEYTMLEWYRSNADYGDVLADCRELLRAVALQTTGSTRLAFAGCTVDLQGEWHQVTVREVFLDAAGWDPVEGYDADRFDLDMVNKVEPALPTDRPVVLLDYPVEAAALARCRPDDPPVAERWELYVAGLELANAYSELTDAAEQRRRFEECAACRRDARRDVYPLDEPFLDALRSGMPPCGGAALGVDRLVMVLTGAESIEQVRAFSEGESIES
jgi:elongation factor P--(R)-beta-lysine ligase